MKNKNLKLDVKALLSLIGIIIGITFIILDGYFIIFKGASYTWYGLITLFLIMFMINDCANYLQEKIESKSDSND